MTTTELAERWTALWNGDLALADTLLTDDFRIHFGGVDEASLAGDSIVGPAQMSTYVEQFRAARPDLHFELDAPPIGETPEFALRWTEVRDGVNRSGIDVLRGNGERIAEVWSVTGGRKLP